MTSSIDEAVVGGRRFEDLAELSHDLGVLDRSGIWVVILPFDAPPVLARFARVTPLGRPGDRPKRPPRPPGPASTASADAAVGVGGEWHSSLDRSAYIRAAEAVRSGIADGDFYQVNICRRLRRDLLRPPAPATEAAEIPTFMAGLAAGLSRFNPAPYAAHIRLPSAGLHVVSASPERFLSRRGERLITEPIKGTAVGPGGLGAKDRAENVMIVDLMRNDLGRICDYGSIEVPSLWRTERHPGLVHLVSTVGGRLRPHLGWAEILGATFPPGSVTGAPKVASLDAIAALEPEPRGVYCGSIGWIDADRREAELNVAIRTFWVEGTTLNVGAGAGITWGSDPAAEWDETELKLSRLLAVADVCLGDWHRRSTAEPEWASA